MNLVASCSGRLFVVTAFALLLACGGGSDPGPGGGGGGGGSGGGSGVRGVNDAQLKILASNLRFPFDLVVDSTQVYWNDAETGSIGAVPIGGGTASFIVPAGSAAGIDLAQDATNIYFTLNDFTLRRVPKGGGAASTLIDTTTRYPGCSGTLCNIIPSGVLVAGGKVIFGNSTSGNGTSTGTGPTALLSIDPSGTGLTNLATANAGTGTAWVTVAADATNVYFASYGNITGNAIKSVPLSGGSATNVLSVSGDLASLAAENGTVYLASRKVGTNDKVLEKVSSGGTSTLATVELQSMRGIAVDGSNVYYPKLDEDSGGSLIAKKSLSTGEETILAGVTATDGIAGGITVDGTNVYWVAGGDSSGDGSIRSVPK